MTTSSDIVERLRHWANFPEGVKRSVDLLEAADEIERLRAALRRINNCAAEHEYDAKAMRDIARAALEGK